MQEKIPKSMFAESVKSVFRLHNSSAHDIELELSEFHDGAKNGGYEQFSLVFKGPSTFLLPQRIYELQHPVLGTVPLFLVPIRQERDGIYYESVFNRLAEGEPEPTK